MSRVLRQARVEQNLAIARASSQMSLAPCSCKVLAFTFGFKEAWNLAGARAWDKNGAEALRNCEVPGSNDAPAPSSSDHWPQTPTDPKPPDRPAHAPLMHRSYKSSSKCGFCQDHPAQEFRRYFGRGARGRVSDRASAADPMISVTWRRSCQQALAGVLSGWITASIVPRLEAGVGRTEPRNCKGLVSNEPGALQLQGSGLHFLG